MDASDFMFVTSAVTKSWTKQRKREERESRARNSRGDYCRPTRVNQSDVALDVIPKAYAKASDNGRLPAHARQIFYAARKEIQDRTERKLDSKYFTQTLLPRYINQHSDARSWWVVYDARGHLSEPHTENELPLGTLDVERYLKKVQTHFVGVPDVQINAGAAVLYPTAGPTNRYSAILFIEKEGFNPLFRETKLAERYDLAIMSTKGQSVVAARRLVDEVCKVGGGVPVLVLHDFDKEGFLISQTLTQISDAALFGERVRYEFRHEVNVIDLGLRLADVEKWGLESESVRFKGEFASDSIATPEDQDFLRGDQRVELNAFSSADFITWIEGKLEEHGIGKVVPPQETLVDAFRRSYHRAHVAQNLDELNEVASAAAAAVTIPADLEQRITVALEQDPVGSWDSVIADIARNQLSEDGDDAAE